MLVVGEWYKQDGVVQPTLDLFVVAFDGARVPQRFLLDSGADRTIFSAALVRDLEWPMSELRPSPWSVEGTTGTSPAVLLTTVLVLPRLDGPLLRLRSEFIALTDPQTTNVSLLGRDILDQFDVILSREKNEILLLRPMHQYTVTVQ